MYTTVPLYIVDNVERHDIDSEREGIVINDSSFFS